MDEYGLITKNYEALAYSILIFLPLILFFIAFMVGRYPITPINVIKTILSPIFPSLTVSPTVSSIVFNVRLPRIIAAILVGASLSIAGATFQGLFKNPLVSPDLLGVSNGAGFGAALAILLSAGNFFIQLGAFVFGLISVSITYGISKSYKAGGTLVLVLSGIAVSAFFNALISGTKYLADPYDKLPEIVFWLMGSLSKVSNAQLVMVLIPLFLGLVIILLLRWHLNLLSMSDEEAQSLGLNPNKLRLIIIFACTLITSASVSISGIIGWVGLVVPHMTRMIVGPNHKILLPASLSIGASFLLLIDTISRTFLSIEIPLGILTALIGVPLFLYLLRKGYSQW
jgi:iron complex transport system permease protein